MRTFGVAIWHDRGLALIYGPVLAGWIFLITFAGLQFFGVLAGKELPVAFFVFIIATVVFIWELHRLDRVANRNPYAKPDQF